MNPPVGYNHPGAWLTELRADCRGRGVRDNVVRLSVRQKTATIGLFEPGRDWDHRPTVRDIQTHTVEASYLNRNLQLVKLSHYVGCADRRPGLHEEVTAATLHKEREVLAGLQKVCGELGLDVRWGVFLEDGTWSADPEEEIVPAEGGSLVGNPHPDQEQEGPRDHVADGPKARHEAGA